MVEKDSQIRFVFAGDIMIGGEFLSYVNAHNLDPLYPFERIVPYLCDSDMVFINLEGPIFRGAERRPGVTSILSNDPVILKLFSQFKTCVVNLANNHIMDYGVEGLNCTTKLLQEKGFPYVGAGKNSKEAEKELVIELKGTRVAFVAYTSNEPHVGAVTSGPESPGCASFQEIDSVIEKIQSLKSTADIICVSLHWGHEYFLYPTPEQRTIAHKLVDAGAHYVIGHHPHVVQGVEMYKDSLIIYSLGNFMFPPFRTTLGRIHITKEITKKFMIVNSAISTSKNLGFGIIGGKVKEDYTMTPYRDTDHLKFNSKMENLIKPLHSSKYNEFWLDYKNRRERELRKETLAEAFKKLSMMTPRELIRTVTIGDIKRNLLRILKIWGKKPV